MKNTIIVRQTKQKELLIEQLKKTPIVQIACEKVGMSRATYYRWKADDTDFAKQAEDALHDGRLLINDMAESQLISEIKERNMTAIIFWLKHNHPSFSTRVEISAVQNKDFKLSIEQKEVLEKALVLSSLVPKSSEL